jgi:hypothetical protein
MCLSASCGAVSEYSGIVSVQDVVQQRLCGRFVDVGLRCGVVEDAVESECLVLDAFALRSIRAPGPVHGIVLWRVEDAALVLVSPGRVATGSRGGIQAALVEDLDDRPDATLGAYPRGRCCGEGAISEEQRRVVSLGELCSFADRKRTHAHRHRDGRRAARHSRARGMLVARKYSATAPQSGFGRRKRGLRNVVGGAGAPPSCIENDPLLPMATHRSRRPLGADGPPVVDPLPESPHVTIRLPPHPIDVSLNASSSPACSLSCARRVDR